MNEDQTFYVAVDVGCYECGEWTSVLGIFTTEEAAQDVLDEHEPRQKAKWHGQHSFEVHRVVGIDQENRREYV